MSDKKRLEAIDERLRETNELEHSESGEVHVVFEKGDIEWLIQQAEKVQELQKDVKRLSDLNYHSNLPAMKSMHEENVRFRKGLEDIAGETGTPYARTAKAALEGETE